MFMNRGLLKYINQTIEYYAANIKLYYGKDMFVKQKAQVNTFTFLQREEYVPKGQLF